MNRAERRAKEKEKKKETNKKVEAMAWFKSLPPTKQLLIDSLIKMEAKKENSNLIEAIDRCFSAAIIQEFDFLEWEDVKKIIDNSADLMLDDANKMKKLKDRFGGSYEMATKKINELGPEVENRLREVIGAGYNQKVSIKMLQEEFKDLSTAMITNAYKKTKAIIKDEQKLKEIAIQEEKSEEVVNRIKEVIGEPDNEIEDAIEYIFDEKIKKENVKEEPQIQIERKNSKLKVVKEVTKVIEREVQGEYGLYNIRGAVVTVNEEFAFMNVEDVNCWASATREELVKQLEEIKSKINHVNSCEAEAIEVIETFMNI